MDNRIYELRQLILEGLNKDYPAGRYLDGLERLSKVEQKSYSRGELETEARNLEKIGYIVNVTGSGRRPYWKITSAGVRQITKDMALDEYVWGEDAL